MTGSSQLTPDAAAELIKLRAEIAAMHQQIRQQQTAAAIRHGWLRHLVTDLETDPHVQYKVHLWGALYWLINFPLVAALFLFARGVWDAVGIFITLVYSIYANLATDYGAMSAAMAAYGQNPLPEIPVQPHVEPPTGPDDHLGHGTGPVERRGDG